MIALVSHSHPLFSVDNGIVFDYIETAIRGTPYTSTITPHRTKRNGRKAYMALKAQHAGKAYWQDVIKTAEDFVKNRKWTGTANVTLTNHLGRHRKFHLDLVEASSHIAHEVPNDRSRVTYALDSLECKDPNILAAIANVRADEAGLRSNFEDMVAYVSPACPVAKKHQSRNKVANVSAANANPSPDISRDKGPRTGVELRWHNAREWHELSQGERGELKEHCDTIIAKQKGRSAGEKGKRPHNQNKGSKKKFKSMISSAVGNKMKVTNEAIQALAESQKALQAIISASAIQPNVVQHTGSVGAARSVVIQPHPTSVEVQPTNDYAKKCEAAQVSCLKLQGILSGKTAKKKQG